MNTDAAVDVTSVWCCRAQRFARTVHGSGQALTGLPASQRSRSSASAPALA